MKEGWRLDTPHAGGKVMALVGMGLLGLESSGDVVFCGDLLFCDIER